MLPTNQLYEPNELQAIIEQAWEDRASLKPGTAPARIGDAVTHVLGELDSGRLRVAEKIDRQWVTHQWLKKAVLLSFRLEDNVLVDAGPMRYFDKVPTKFAHYDTHRFETGGFRVVPPAVARRGSFIGARSEVVEGVIVEDNCVVSMGVYISQSTKIYDRASGEISYGRIPEGSVVVSGNLPSSDGKYSLYCAVIVKRVDAQTRAKTSINELLRD